MYNSGQSQPPADRALLLRSYEFRARREASWERLEALVRRVERLGLGVLDPEELGQLPVLYRNVVSSLSVARSLTLDKNVIAYLEGLSSRAYLCVYSTKQRLGESLRAFFGARFPSLVRSMRWAIVLAAALMALGSASGALLTRDDPDLFYSFVDEEMASGRSPLSTREELREVLYHGPGSMSSELTALASFLFSNNARIGMLSFALGFLGGIPVLLLIFVNGLTLGAFFAIHLNHDLGTEFWLWVLPHGVTELLALCLCGGAGFHVAYGLLFPGRLSRLESIALSGREAAAVVAGSVAMFFIAAIIEGFFRQLVQDPLIRLAMVAVTSAAWTAYFGLAGREEGRKR